MITRNEHEDRSIGITDLLAYRECPRRASYGLRRHTPNGEQDPWLRTPEAGSRAAAYGSAVHDAIAALEDGHNIDTAIQLAWNRWHRWLQPEDLALLREDMARFPERDFPGTRTVLAEDEIRIPVTLHDGSRAYFRGRIDRLYERLDAPGTYIHVDYKSSRHPKSQGDVDEDLQMWAYNWGLHEWLPEIDDLVQCYDQLRFGQLFTRKTDKQRALFRDWLIAEMSAYFADEDVQEDGLLAPRHNEWCAWCPILESCPIIPELSEWALTRINELMGIEHGLDAFAEEYSDAKEAMKLLKRFTDSVADVVKELPEPRRQGLGFKVSARANSTFSPTSLARLQARLGGRFLELVSLPKTRLESLDEDTKAWALELMEPTTPTTVVSRKDPEQER